MSESLKNKLEQYKAQPPSRVWPAIEAALNEPFDETGNRLYHFETPPPDQLWKKIESSLTGSSNAAPVVPFFARYGKSFKYTAAAAILVLITTGVILFFNKNASNHLANTTTPKKSSGSNPEMVVTTPSEKKNPTSNNLPAPANSNKNQPDKNIAKNEVATTQETATATQENRYLTFANEKGKVVRLSKKVLPVFNCAGNVAATNNQSCKENIETLQNKMATSLVMPSDFAGFINMLKDLKENP